MHAKDVILTTFLSEAILNTRVSFCDVSDLRLGTGTSNPNSYSFANLTSDSCHLVGVIDFFKFF